MSIRAAELIERIGVVHRAARRAAAGEAGLTLAQFDALRYLAACNRFSDTPADVAEYLDATRGTTSQTLLALERKGLVSRSADPRDGRVSHLTPTPGGLCVVAAADSGRIEDAIGDLGMEGKRLEELLEQVLRATQRSRGGRAFGRCAACRHLRGEPGARHCGLTDEPLTDVETTLLCAEHEPAR